MVDFEKDFHKLLKNAFYGKTMKNVRNGIKVEFIKKDDNENNIKQQSKITFKVFINFIQTMIVTYSSKIKFLRISQFI